MAKGFVYILANSSFNALKIGQSSNHPDNRALELYDTGVPTPYEVVGWILVDRFEYLERLVHDDLAGMRVNPKREFFNCSVATAVASIRKLTAEHDLEVEVDKLPHVQNARDRFNRGRVKASPSVSIPYEYKGIPRIRVLTICPACGKRDERYLYDMPVTTSCRCRGCGHEYREAISEMKKRC